MIVKIGDTVYSSDNDMILLILSNEEKQAIADMGPEDYKLCRYPDGVTPEQALLFMSFGDEDED